MAAAVKKTAAAASSSPAPGTRRGPAASSSQGGSGKHRGQAAVETKAAKAGVSKGAIGKAAAAEVAGGGPEDPLADAAAAASLFKGSKKKASDAASGAAKNVVGGNKALLAEFVICFVILGLGTIVKPGSNSVPRLMLKSSALAGVFLVLALTSAMGGKARKTATALGGLVTLTYVVSSSDAIAIFNWANSYFGTATANNAGEAIGNLGSAVSGGASVTTEGNTSTPTPGTAGGGSTGAAQ